MMYPFLDYRVKRPDAISLNRLSFSVMIKFNLRQAKRLKDSISMSSAVGEKALKQW